MENSPFYFSNSSNNLKRHVAAVHKKMERFPCPHCKFVSHYRDNVRRHIQTVHCINAQVRKSVMNGNGSLWNPAPSRISLFLPVTCICKLCLFQIQKYACALCDFTTVHIESLRRHEALHREKMNNTSDSGGIH